MLPYHHDRTRSITQIGTGSEFLELLHVIGLQNWQNKISILSNSFRLFVFQFQSI